MNDYDKITGSFLDEHNHQLDRKLIKNIIDFCLIEDISSVIDLGCGWSGGYVEALRDADIDCIGYDGNPKIKDRDKPYLKHLLLNEPISQEFIDNNKRDLVISLEVGEHIPKKYQNIYVDNITALCNKYLIVSWAIPNQGGLGHVNELPKSISRELFISKKFKTKWNLEKIFRNTSELFYFKDTIMIFEKL